MQRILILTILTITMMIIFTAMRRLTILHSIIIDEKIHHMSRFVLKQNILLHRISFIFIILDAVLLEVLIEVIVTELLTQIKEAIQSPPVNCISNNLHVALHIIPIEVRGDLLRSKARIQKIDMVFQ